MSTAWDNGRRHARALETALEGKVSSYSKLAAVISRGTSSSAGSSSDSAAALDEEGVGRYKLVEEEIEELLGKVHLGSLRIDGDLGV